MGAGSVVKGQHAGCIASGQPLTIATLKTLFPRDGSQCAAAPCLPGEVADSPHRGDEYLAEYRVVGFCQAQVYDSGLVYGFRNNELLKLLQMPL